MLLALLGIVGTAQAMDCHTYGKDWIEKNLEAAALKICQPPELALRVEGDDIYWVKARFKTHSKTSSIQNGVDIALHGRRMSTVDDYVLHIKVVQQNLVLGYEIEGLFKSEDGVMKARIGRYQDPVAEGVRLNGWSGYKSTVICSQDGSSIGFHAAGGECLWIQGGNSQRYFVLDTMGEHEDAILGWKIAKSIHLTK